jgi:ribonucleoside-diphosphate reductase alpha chain
LEEQRRGAFAKRRIALGITGLADALIMTSLRYGSPEAAAQAERWAELISHTAYRTSCDLAVEKGVFPLFG